MELSAELLYTTDDLRAVTVGTSDCDEGHEPLLVVEHCQEEAQCAINRSPSPLLEHYPPIECRERLGGLLNYYHRKAA
jgi:hypothetical protein